MADDGAPNLLGMIGLGIGANPLGALGAAAGIGASIFGGLKSYQSAQQQFGAESKIFGLEQQAEAQRKQMMELNAKRLSLETVRHAQRARAQSIAGSQQGGSQLGSGLAGGLGQISGQAGTGLLGISQQLQSGEALFGINSQISQQRMAYAQAGSQAYTGQAISGAGQSIFGTTRALGQSLSFLG